MITARVEPEQKGFDWNGLTLFLLALAAFVLCLLIVWPFLSGITAAIVLAVVTERPQRWLCARVRSRTLAASIALVIVVLSIVVPALLLVQAVGGHVIDFVRSAQTLAVEPPGVHAFLEQHPKIERLVIFLQQNIDSDQMIEKSVSTLATKIGPLLGHSISAIFQVVVMLFILFFLYRDKDVVLRFVHSLLPLTEEETMFLLARLQTTVYALVLGRFAVAGTQGMIAGATFAVLGVNGFVLLGVATAVCALVPAVGAVVVWLPVVIYLAILHHWIQAAILFAIGSLIISTLDNFLYPIFVGSHLRLHTVPIFLAMLGGVLLFGVMGLVLGPITFNIAVVLAQIWRGRAGGEPLPVADTIF